MVFTHTRVQIPARALTELVTCLTVIVFLPVFKHFMQRAPKLQYSWATTTASTRWNAIYVGSSGKITTNTVSFNNNESKI